MKNALGYQRWMGAIALTGYLTMTPHTVQAADLPQPLAARVKLVDIVMDERGGAKVQCFGQMYNASTLPLREVQFQVDLLDDQDRPFQTVTSTPLPLLGGKKLREFKIETALTGPIPGRIRAVVSSGQCQKATWPEVIAWVLDGQYDRLALWQIPVDKRIIDDVNLRRPEARRILAQVKPDDPDYLEVSEKLVALGGYQPQMHTDKNR